MVNSTSKRRTNRLGADAFVLADETVGFSPKMAPNHDDSPIVESETHVGNDLTSISMDNKTEQGEGHVVDKTLLDTTTKAQNALSENTRQGDETDQSTVGQDSLATDLSATVHDDNRSSAEKTSDEESSTGSVENYKMHQAVMRQRRRRKQPRVASIQSSITSKSPDDDLSPRNHNRSGLTLPLSQYECVLVRRAIKSVDPNDPVEDEIHGDVSLGMKLSVAETGQVVVQHVLPLKDGRASPAQLTGIIQRGDILLSIDGINLTAQNALVGLNPLRGPATPIAACQRSYKLRFAAAAGLHIVESIEEKRRLRQSVHNGPTTEMLSLFPMVDQLSGVPLIPQDLNQIFEESEQAKTSVVSSPPLSSELAPTEKSLTMNEEISICLAWLRGLERKVFAQSIHGLSDEHHEEGMNTFLTLSQRQDIGRRTIAEAQTLLKEVENIDAGKDLRSFQSWNTTLSLYSRASTRRRRVFDAASLPLNFGKVDEEDEEKDDSNDAASNRSSTNSEQLDGDEVLLRLAAHDDIWRKQVIEFLEKVAQESDDSTESPAEKSQDAVDMNAALSNELGSFLFGENMTSILAKNKTPRSLPSEEVTAVLFDLTTKLSDSVPDEIRASGSLLSDRSGLAPFRAMKRQTAGSDDMLATQFLLNRALPAWLKSFRPLAWEHRRILWPVERLHNGSTAASTFSDDGSLTVDSASTNLSMATSKRKKKDIREIIEDQELNIETRGETCFLVTYFFIHALLPRLMLKENLDAPENEKARDEIVVFLGEYGSYLKMHTCLAYAGALKADTVVDLLLSIAKHDPRHKEVTKQTRKNVTMVFYEPTMLSAVLQLLHGISTETKDRQLSIVDLCSSAFPDVRPWQVKKACDEAYVVLGDRSSDIYYGYLSLLLHPVDGHDDARKNPCLVKEWCLLSAGNGNTIDASQNEMKTNFFSVASRASSHHLVYHRDLQHLLRLSMKMCEPTLALDLCGEILDHETLSVDPAALKSVLIQIRVIGSECLGYINDKEDASNNLKRILRLFTKESLRVFVDVPTELLSWIKGVSLDGSTGLRESSERRALVEFLSYEADPTDMLRALAAGYQTSHHSRPELLPSLRTILTRSASAGSELSASFLRIKQARSELDRVSLALGTQSLSKSSKNIMHKQTIWKALATGKLPIEK